LIWVGLNHDHLYCVPIMHSRYGWTACWILVRSRANILDIHGGRSL
jgi:hypothetical protein